MDVAFKVFQEKSVRPDATSAIHWQPVKLLHESVALEDNRSELSFDPIWLYRIAFYPRGMCIQLTDTVHFWEECLSDGESIKDKVTKVRLG